MTGIGIGIRRAVPSDAARIAAIYNEGIAGRGATFETDPRSPADVEAWFGKDGAVLLVAEDGGGIAGWAGTERASERCAYAGVGDYALYVDPESQRRGIGRALLDALCTASEEAGYWKLLGKVFTTNRASIAVAERCGFRIVGVHERHGRLDGEWKDVVVLERLLGEAAAD